jgi:tetratricopeptide (TPR) repeat protein
MQRVRSLLLTLLVFVLLGTTQALGAPPSGVDASVQARAQAHYEQGVAAYRQQQFRDAIGHFLAADAIVQSPALPFNVARAYEKLGESARALEYYRIYLHRGPDPKNEQQVRARVREIEMALAKLGVQQMTVRSNPAGANVTIDGTARGTTPWTGELALGRHQVVLDYGSLERQLTVELVPEQALDVDVALAGPAAEDHREQYAAGSAESAPPSEAHAMPAFVPWVVAGTGVLALGAAGVYELKRQGAESDAKAEKYQPAYYDDRDRMSSYQTTARVFAGVGAALIVTGGVLAIVSKPTTAGDQPETPPAVAFGCDGKACAGLWRGTF